MSSALYSYSTVPPSCLPVLSLFTEVKHFLTGRNNYHSYKEDQHFLATAGDKLPRNTQETEDAFLASVGITFLHMLNPAPPPPTRLCTPQGQSQVCFAGITSLAPCTVSEMRGSQHDYLND